MIENRPIVDILTQLLLFLGLVFALLPFVLVALAASQDLRSVNLVPMPLWPGHDFLVNMGAAWTRGHFGERLLTSLIFAVGVAAGKVVIAAISAFSIVYFGYRGRTLIFWLVFITLMLPLEVRIVPTYAVAANVLYPYQAILDGLGVTWLVEALTGHTIGLQLGLSIPMPA